MERRRRGGDDIAIDAWRNPSLETSFSKWLTAAAEGEEKSQWGSYRCSRGLERSRMTQSGFSRGEKVTRVVPDSAVQTPVSTSAWPSAHNYKRQMAALLIALFAEA